MRSLTRMFAKAFNVLRAPQFLIGAFWKWHEYRISEMPGITWNAGYRGGPQ